VHFLAGDDYETKIGIDINIGKDKCSITETSKLDLGLQDVAGFQSLNQVVASARKRRPNKYLLQVTYGSV
jgi:hypothetical protein